MSDRVLNKPLHYVVMLLFISILFSILQPQQTFPVQSQQKKHQCSKLTINTPESIVNFEHISHHISSIPIVDFE